MHLYTEAKAIATQALQEAEGDLATARELLHEMCDWHPVSMHYGKAINFCATQDTSAGEEWLDDCGGSVQAGDTFGSIACRITFATLFCAAEEALQELEADSEVA